MTAAGSFASPHRRAITLANAKHCSRGLIEDSGVNWVLKCCGHSRGMSRRTSFAGWSIPRPRAIRTRRPRSQPGADRARGTPQLASLCNRPTTRRRNRRVGQDARSAVGVSGSCTSFAVDDGQGDSGIGWNEAFPLASMAEGSSPRAGARFPRRPGRPVLEQVPHLLFALPSG